MTTNSARASPRGQVRGSLKTAALTAAALVAFAGNSWLCRAALRPTGGERAIDPASFTALRVASGALVLVLLVVLRGGSLRQLRAAGSAGSALALFAYAIAFSYAYLELGVGVGALIAFGAVQLTMVAGSIRAGQAPTAVEGLGLALALAGLATLTLPGASAPPPFAAGGMALAGVAWGIYSLRGQRERAAPLDVTAGNFVRAVPLVALTSALTSIGALTGSALHVSWRGATLALISGGLTSGVGSAIWYAALPRLRAFQAGLVQLAVPVIAGAGGALFFTERPSLRLAAAAILVLVGLALAILGSTARRPESRSIAAQERRRER
jgi:drug/metabolite transporter (DMT)-like permease